MINSALERNDYETVRNGLYSLKKYTIVLMERDVLQDCEINNKINNVTAHVFHHLEKIGEHAINRRNDDSTSTSAKVITEITIKAAEIGLEEMAIKGMNILIKMGIQSVYMEREIPSMYIAKNITKIGLETIISEKYEVAKNSIKEHIKIANEANEKIMKICLKKE